MTGLMPVALDLFERQTALWMKIDLKLDSSPYSEHCQIEAIHDLEAVAKWLDEYKHQKNTYAAYKREVVRFILWCVYERGINLKNLKKEDLEQYFLFCQAPPDSWRELKTENDGKADWKPFRGPLRQSALLTAVRILSSFFNYLVQADYLRANPIKLIKKYAKLSIANPERKYQVWARILELDEWQAVQVALIEMTEVTTFEKENKRRTQFLLALLYFLGLRIHEVMNLCWGSFYTKNNQWWLLVKGKGDKLGHVPVNHQLLNHIQSYRQFLNKTALPTVGESEPLLVSKKTHKSLKITQLYSLIKAIGKIAAKHFEGNPEKQRKLMALSPHWLRHLAASHQDRLGMPLAMIKENLRHQSSQTTQIYVHTEDDERFHQMQKMEMQMEPQSLNAITEVVGMAYRLKLAKGPVNKIVGLARVLTGIEQQIFKGITWVNVGLSQEALLEKVQREGWANEAVEIVYQVSTEASLEKSKLLAEAIKRQCESWLFTVEIEMMEIKNHG